MKNPSPPFKSFVALVRFSDGEASAKLDKAVLEER
jgi:hypothetical protein